MQLGRGREEAPATTGLPRTECQNQTGERGLPHMISLQDGKTENGNGLTGTAFGGPQCQR